MLLDRAINGIEGNRLTSAENDECKRRALAVYKVAKIIEKRTGTFPV
jgi:hypothetical protein